MVSFLGKRHPAVCSLPPRLRIAPRGRAKDYPVSVMALLEGAVNAKAVRCEASDTSLAERFTLACNYAGITDAELARKLGYSRELVRCWRLQRHQPRCMNRLATLLGVPEHWLANGGEEHLPAHSHLGVRVGEENHRYREELYGITLGVVAELADEADEHEVRTHIEATVCNRPALAMLARRAGGRWQVNRSQLVFVPWVPIREHGLDRRFWADEVEALITEVLGSERSIYAAWEALRRRCDAKGLAYPRKISLYKRITKAGERAAQFGVDLNEDIVSLCRRCGKTNVRQV